MLSSRGQQLKVLDISREVLIDEAIEMSFMKSFMFIRVFYQSELYLCKGRKINKEDTVDTVVHVLVLLLQLTNWNRHLYVLMKIF